MITASCHCGAVRLETEVPPEEVTECNCSICRRLGSRLAINTRGMDPDVVANARGRLFDGASM